MRRTRPGVRPRLGSELARSERLLHLFGVEDEPYLELGLEHVRRALELDPDEPSAHMTLGSVLLMRGEGEAGLASARRALELAPGDANLRLEFATLLNFASRSEEAIPVLKNLPRLDPARRWMHSFQLAVAYRRLGRIDEAIAKHRESLQARPEFYGAHMNLVAIYASLGEMNQARESLAELMHQRPDFTMASVPRLPTGREFLVENLRKAGLRE